MSGIFSIIDYLRGKDDVKEYIENIHDDIYISVITIAIVPS
jgi:hypothetical protein